MDKKRKCSSKNKSNNKKPRRYDMGEEVPSQEVELQLPPRNTDDIHHLDISMETSTAMVEEKQLETTQQTEEIEETDKFSNTHTDSSKLTISKRQFIGCSVIEQQSPIIFTATTQNSISTSSSSSFRARSHPTTPIATTAHITHTPLSNTSSILHNRKNKKEKRANSLETTHTSFQFQAPDVKAPQKQPKQPDRRKVSSFIFPQLVWLFIVLAMSIAFFFQTSGKDGRIFTLENRIFTLESQLKQCNCQEGNDVISPSGYARVSIPVHEDAGSLDALDYLNKASAHYTGGALSFVVWNESVAEHKLAVYAMQYLGRIDSAQEVMIAKMKEAGISNVVLAIIRFMAPKLGERELGVHYDFSGYKCGKKEIATHLELAWYLLSPGNKDFLPFVCEDDNSLCDQRNPKLLEKFFQHLDFFYKNC